MYLEDLFVFNTSEKLSIQFIEGLIDNMELHKYKNKIIDYLDNKTKPTYDVNGRFYPIEIDLEKWISLADIKDTRIHIKNERSRRKRIRNKNENISNDQKIARKLF